MKRKIYIAGKVTGLPQDEVIEKFAIVQKEIEALGFEVINPLKVVGDWNTPWTYAMRKCIKALVDCDAVYLLPCHIHSTGAKIEFKLAFDLNIPFYYMIEHLNTCQWSN
jgi:hypothetical protein